MRKFSDHEDRAYAAEALERIRQTFWTPRNQSWFGKSQDGEIIRLDAPRAIPAPLPSRLGIRGWHLQLTVTSDVWRTYPGEPRQEPFVTVYAITRYSATSWDIRVTDGAITAPLQHADAERIRAEL